jgi:hypothetical protein
MMRWFLAIALLLATAARPALAGCDLGQVVGYVEDGKRVQGYAGCNRDRVLVFTDGTGVRCKDVGTASASLPTAYLFAKTQNDMKLCVGDDLFDVARPN